ncbi:MAG: phenylacetyl-CoA:acceptor oxidoreductase [Gammaproteobacteria bacterium]|nr:phenylacetyl-CoA:acceptor oxidoreductase [Gammaproteobacteria bacterium]
MNRFGSKLQTHWDWRAAGNFMFGGTGCGLILMSAAASYPNSLPLALGLQALAFIGLGLFLVWLEIGRPWRALHVFFHPQTSWMTREGSVGTILMPLALAGLFMDIPGLVALSGILGLLYLFCQGRILLASKGIPSWREPAVVPLILSTGLSEGSGLLILTLYAIGMAPIQGWVFFSFIAFLAFRTYSWTTYLGKLNGSKAPKKTLSILNGINPLMLWGANVAPIALLLTSMFISTYTGLLSCLAAALAVAGGWYMKFTIVARASQVQGYSLGKLQKGRPKMKAPVRRKPDSFVFDQKYEKENA